MNEQELILIECLLKKLLSGICTFLEDGFAVVCLNDDLSGEIRKPLIDRSFACELSNVVEFYRENIGVVNPSDEEDPDFDAYFVGSLPDESPF